MIQLTHIKAYQIGLVMKERKLVKVLTEGQKYWTKWNESVKIHSVFNPLQLIGHQKLMLENEELRKQLNLIEVTENELVFKYEDGLFTEILTRGSYAFFKNPLKIDYKKYDISEMEVPKELTSLLRTHPILANFVLKYEVKAHEKGILMINGEFVKELKSGFYHFWKNDNKIEILLADTRQQLIEVNGQEILTKDKADLRINLDATYTIVDIKKALLENKKHIKMLYVLLQNKLRTYVGQFTLDEILENKAEMSEKILKMVSNETENLGVKVTQAEIRDIILPGDMKEIMNQVLIAQKKAQANTITRREETAQTRSLLNTAKLMEDNPMLMQLKEMEYVENIADKIGEITVSGNGGMVKQLKEIFSVKG